MSVFYRDIDVNISDYKSELSKPLIVYERDRGLEIYFNLIRYAYRFDKNPSNLLENLVGAYATVTLVNPSGYEIGINEVEITEDAKVKFVITEDLTDELTEIGTYQLQIHVNNDVEGRDTSVFSIPPFNFEVIERLKGKKNELLDSEGNGLTDNEGYQLVSASTNKVINFSVDKINEYLSSIPTIQDEIKDLNSQLEHIAKYNDALNLYNENIINVSSPIIIDGNNYINNTATFDFGKTIFNVTNNFPNSNNIIQFRNFEKLKIINLKITGNLKYVDNVFYKGDVELPPSTDTNINNNGLWINDCYSVVIENCDITNCSGIALNVKRVDNVSIRDSKVNFPYITGIFVGGSTEKVFINNCKCYGIGDLGDDKNLNVGGIGILVSESNNVTISECLIEGFQDCGTKTEGCSNVEYFANVVDGFGKDGIKVMGYPNTFPNVENNRIVNNVVKNKFYGRTDGSAYIVMHDTKNGIIDGNIISKNNDRTGFTENGIRVNFLNGTISNNIKIINNTIKTGVSEASIYLDALSKDLYDIDISNNNMDSFINNLQTRNVNIYNNKISLNSNVTDSCIFSYKTGDIKIKDNKINCDNVDVIYIMPSIKCKNINIENNNVIGGRRLIRITDSDKNSVIENLIIKDNNGNMSDYLLNAPNVCMYIGSVEQTINNCIVTNNSITKITNPYSEIFCFWDFSGFNCLNTYINDLYYNSNEADVILKGERYGRVVGNFKTNTKPNYVTKFKEYDTILRLTPNSTIYKYIFIGGQWIEKTYE